MKTIILAFAVFATVGVSAQSDKYVNAMQATITQFDSAKSPADFQNVSAAFVRIANAEKTQWLPYYYAGLALSREGWMDQSLDKDANSGKIESFCDQAEANAGSPSDKAEIYVLRNMAETQQMMVDPQSRWQTNGQAASADLEKGMSLDSTNPRLYYLKGMSLFNTPEQFGGGKDKAKPEFEKAVELFKTFTVKPLYPNWGQQQAIAMLAKCQ